MTRILPHDHEHRFATRSVHAGQVPEPLAGAVMTPIYQTSTYVQDGLGRHKGYEYARTQNPTREALERNVAALEGGSHGFAFGSGLAALDTLLKLLRSGDHVVCGENVYGGTYRLMERVYSELGLTFTFVDMRDVGSVERALTPATRMVYCETPTNPMMNLVDLAAVGDLTPGPRTALFVVDNTFATPYFQRPLEFGADIVLHSTTKYLNGHSDMVGGLLVTRRDDLAERIGFIQNAAGGGARADGLLARPARDQDAPPPDAAARRQRPAHRRMAGAPLGRGEAVLSGAPVASPARAGLPPDDRVRRDDLARPGRRRPGPAVRGGRSDLRAGRIARRSGEPDRPSGQMTHASVPPAMRQAMGLTDSLVRLSCGVEDTEDLIEDLDQAFAAA